MESLFLLAFGEKEVPAAPARASSEAFFNKLLISRRGTDEIVAHLRAKMRKKRFLRWCRGFPPQRDRSDRRVLVTCFPCKIELRRAAVA
jgi:hypothetical protein